MDNIGVKIKNNDDTTKYLSIIRKYTKLSTEDIENKIINNQYVMLCGYTDEDGIRNILKAYNEIKNLGADAIIYEHDIVTTVDFLMNLIDKYSDIQRDILQIDDLMYNDDWHQIIFCVKVPIKRLSGL